jgi:hypothetical protein
VTPRSGHVWYAAYGSNLSRERFDVYLHGGTPRGASHTYPGCRDAGDPIEDVAGEIGAELTFGGTSQTWGGGVAFLVPSATATAKARLYLLTIAQVADVIAQENWLEPGAVEIDDLMLDRTSTIPGSHMYGTVVVLHRRNGVPVLAVSQDPGTPLNAPSATYLRHIADGLREAHGMSDEQIVSYLAAKPGVSGSLSPDDLARHLDG